MAMYTYCSPETVMDPVDYGRGYISAHAYVSPTSAREVHIQKLRYAFERAGMAHQLRYAVRVISLMREAQELAGGFWFPTPLRAVPVAGYAILLGCIPTPELQRHFPAVAKAGHARVIPKSEKGELPTQDLDNWLDQRVQDSLTWAQGQLAMGQATMGLTVASNRVEYFNIRSVPSGAGSTNVPRWSAEVRSALVRQGGLVLCRESVGGVSFRYFQGSVRRGRLIGEAAAPSDIQRLLCGFAALMGSPLTATMMSSSGHWLFTLPITLPRPERQLVLAVGRRSELARGRSYLVTNECFASMVAEKLRRLGCEVRSTDA